MVTNQIPRISSREDHMVFRCCNVMVPIIAHYCATRLECHVTLVLLRCPSLGLFRNLRYWMTLALRGTPLEENNSIEHCFTETVNTSLWLYSSSYDMIEIIQKANCPSISFNTPVSANHFWYKSQKHRQGADTKYHSRPWYGFYFFLTHGSSKRHDGRPENTVKRKGPLKIHDFLAEPCTRMDKERINWGEESMAPWSGFAIWTSHRCKGDSCLSRLSLRSRSPFAFLHFIKTQTLSFFHEESKIP